MPQFFIIPEPGEKNCMVTGDDYLHCVNVRRVKTGDILKLRGPDGSAYRGLIETIQDSSIRIALVQKFPPRKNSCHLALYLPLLKGKNFELALQKAVEVGAGEIIPLETSRSIPKLKDISEDKFRRWQKIADEASKQCMRSETVPLGRGVTFEKMVTDSSGPSIIAHPGGTPFVRMERENFRGEIALAIGPEGGFDSRELLLAREANWQIAAFGENHLRAETAAIVIPALVLHEWNRLTEA